MYEFGGKVMKRAIGIFLIAQALLGTVNNFV
jgi:hypothetical protein